MQQRGYFADMQRQMDCGGYEGLLHYLLNFDLSTVDVGVIPHTTALMDQKEHSFDPVRRYWFERLRDGASLTHDTRWEEYVPTESLYEDFVRRCQTWGIQRRPSDTQLIRELEEVSPSGSFGRIKRSCSVMGVDGFKQDRRVWCYEMPSLDAARRSFEEKIGSTIAWPIEGQVSSPTVIDDERMI